MALSLSEKQSDLYNQALTTCVNSIADALQENSNATQLQNLNQAQSLTRASEVLRPVLTNFFNSNGVRATNNDDTIPDDANWLVTTLKTERSFDREKEDASMICNNVVVQAMDLMRAPLNDQGPENRRTLSKLIVEAIDLARFGFFPVMRSVENVPTVMVDEESRQLLLHDDQRVNTTQTDREDTVWKTLVETLKTMEKSNECKFKNNGYSRFDFEFYNESEWAEAHPCVVEHLFWNILDDPTQRLVPIGICFAVADALYENNVSRFVETLGTLVASPMQAYIKHISDGGSAWIRSRLKLIDCVLGAAENTAQNVYTQNVTKRIDAMKMVNNKGCLPTEEDAAVEGAAVEEGAVGGDYGASTIPESSDLRRVQVSANATFHARFSDVVGIRGELEYDFDESNNTEIDASGGASNVQVSFNVLMTALKSNIIHVVREKAGFGAKYRIAATAAIAVEDEATSSAFPRIIVSVVAFPKIAENDRDDGDADDHEKKIDAVEILLQKLTYKRTRSIYGVAPEGEFYTQRKKRQSLQDDLEYMKVVTLRRVKWWLEGYDVASEEFTNIQAHLTDEPAPRPVPRAAPRVAPRAAPRSGSDELENESDESDESDDIGPLSTIAQPRPPPLKLSPELVPCCLSDAQLDLFKQETFLSNKDEIIQRLRRCRGIIANALAIDEQSMHCLLVNVTYWNSWSRDFALGQTTLPFDAGIFQNTLSKHPLYMQFETVFSMASGLIHRLVGDGVFSSNFSFPRQVSHALNLHRNTALQAFHSLKLPQQSGARQAVPLSNILSLLPFFKTLDRVGSLMFDALVMVEHFASSMKILSKRRDLTAASVQQKQTVIGACREHIHRLYHSFDSSFARLLFACRNRSQWVSSGMLGIDDFKAKIQAAAEQVVLVRDSWNSGMLGVFTGIVGKLIAQQFDNPLPELKAMLQRSVEWVKTMQSAFNDNDDIRLLEDNSASMTDWFDKTNAFFEEACVYHTQSFFAVLSGYAYVYSTRQTLAMDTSAIRGRQSKEEIDYTKQFVQEFDTMNSHREANKIFALKCMVLRDMGVADNDIIAKEIAAETTNVDDVTRPRGRVNSQREFDGMDAFLPGREDDEANPVRWG